MKTKPDDSVLLRRLEKHHPDVLKAEIDFDAESAKIINAEGEFQASARLADAADVIARNPVTIQLRYLQTLIEVSGNQSSTIVFPLPMEIAGMLGVGRAKDGNAG